MSKIGNHFFGRRSLSRQSLVVFCLFGVRVLPTYTRIRQKRGWRHPNSAFNAMHPQLFWKFNSIRDEQKVISKISWKRKISQTPIIEINKSNQVFNQSIGSNADVWFIHSLTLPVIVVAWVVLDPTVAHRCHHIIRVRHEGIGRWCQIIINVKEIKCQANNTGHRDQRPSERDGDCHPKVEKARRSSPLVIVLIGSNCTAATEMRVQST